MNAMHSQMRGFALTLAVLWTLLCIAAAVYSDQKDIPLYITIAVVPAFLLETGFYLASVLRSTRQRLERLPPGRLALFMTLSAPVSYVAYSVSTGVFSWQSAASILGLAALASFWFVLFGRRTSTDVLYLAVLAIPILWKVFRPIYLDPIPRLQLHVLGALMWYRIGLLAVLSIRRMEGINFGLVPAKRDWYIGLRNFAYLLPLAFAAGYYLDFFRLRPSLGWMMPLVFLGTFVVTLWVLATAEEFFFRGLIQQLVTRISGNKWVGLATASVLFGLAHLWFRQFPNWRLVLLATFAGFFFGRAYMEARSIKAPMVTHALVVAVWKVFLV